MDSTTAIDLWGAFIDSSVLFAASLSATDSARDLIVAGTRGRVALVVSNLVFLETRRNLAAKAPPALAYLDALEASGTARLVNPPRFLVLEVAKVVEAKDAPIVAAAVAGRVRFLASYDRKHLHAQAASIHARVAVEVVTPDQLLRRLLDS